MNHKFKTHKLIVEEYEKYRFLKGKKTKLITFNTILLSLYTLLKCGFIELFLTLLKIK